MEKAIKILLIALTVWMTIQPASVMAKRDKPAVTPEKHRKVFVLKTDRKLVGGTVEILSSHGNIVSSQTLLKRKMIIDFGDVKYDAYTIRISKGDRIKEFIYDQR
jgi:hypothetical protein